jgi:ethanolamine utilization cobalamin adenosyltransferase
MVREVQDIVLALQFVGNIIISKLKFLAACVSFLDFQQHTDLQRSQEDGLKSHLLSNSKGKSIHK